MVRLVHAKLVRHAKAKQIAARGRLQGMSAILIRITRTLDLIWKTRSALNGQVSGCLWRRWLFASHLVKRFKGEGFWVRGVDIKRPEFSASAADDFQLLDLRKPENCPEALTLRGRHPDEVYQLAADMGGMGFIHSAECEILRNNALINIHMVHAAARLGCLAIFSPPRSAFTAT